MHIMKYLNESETDTAALRTNFLYSIVFSEEPSVYKVSN